MNHSVKIVKSSYYVRKLENVKSDIKSTWKALNEVINKRPKTNFSSSFKSSIDNTEIPDPVEIANKLSSATSQFLVLVQTLLRKFTHLLYRSKPPTQTSYKQNIGRNVFINIPSAST